MGGYATFKGGLRSAHKHREGGKEPCDSIPIPNDLGCQKKRFVPVHSMSNAVCQKYQDVILHPVAFCSMQTSCSGRSDPQSSVQWKMRRIDWAAERVQTDDRSRHDRWQHFQMSTTCFSWPVCTVYVLLWWMWRTVIWLVARGRRIECTPDQNVLLAVYWNQQDGCVRVVLKLRDKWK